MEESIFQTILAILKSLAVLITLFSWVMIAYAIIKKREVIDARPKEALPVSRTQRENGAPLGDIRAQKIAREGWARIIDKVDVAEQKDFKSAVIEADALVDNVLKAYSYPGENMGERMRSVKIDELPSLDDLWNAHKLRNTIAHHPTYTVTVKQGHDALKTYKKVLEELGAI